MCIRDRVRTGAPIRGERHFGAFSLEDGVHLRGELRVAVVDDRADRDLQVLHLHTDISRLLADPGRVRLIGAGAEDHAAALDLDEDQSVENAEERGVDDKEVGRDDRARLSTKELAPGESTASRGTRNSTPAENQPDRGVGYAKAELEQFTLDTTLAPARVVLGHGQDQILDLVGDGWSTMPRAS